jgi:hypothetical protein
MQTDPKEMSRLEKLHSMEAIWEALHDDLGGDLDSPQWHGYELQERQRRIDSGEASFLSLQELKTRR